MRSEYIQVLTSIDSAEKAAVIAQTLLEKRLAACVQILGPIQSHYWWQGQREQSQEWLCLAKTRQELYPAVESAIRAVHPYQTPEILATPILAGLAEYLAWLDQEVCPLRSESVG
ncbi:MAG: divalent-cation tolerance protein CutA [Thermoguttaceae bacterium]|nr:divalent-cation tolerance protein CutA [Thermoguttaceae bacterium]MDW8037816.1 divalent-cation tolerance protein CutA [Thermoguttaceae bacterium]